jgi:uncharacterized protein YbjQ (UPF0145 family)
MDLCYCGLIKQAKAGTTVINGVETCNRCGLPTSAPPDLNVTHDTRGPSSMVTTLDQLPGHQIVAVHGVVTDLSANAGWTAATKGNNALDEAMDNLRRAARRMSGNAIVGLRASTFGAGGGITSALGGDAVGVLLIGTSVTVDPYAPEPSAAL